MKRYLLMGLSSLCFAPVAIVVKLIGESVPVMSVVFLRFFLGFLVLAAITPLLDRQAFRPAKKDLGGYFLIGFFMAVSVSFFVSASLFAPVQNVVLINKISPFFVLIFASFFLHERVTKKKLVALAIAFLGLAIINPFSPGPHELGNLLAFGSAVTAGAMWAGMRKENTEHGIGDVMWFFLFGSLLLFPFPIVFGLGSAMEFLPHLLFLGIISSGFAYLFMNLALEELEAEEASIISMILTPVAALELAVLSLGETLLPQTLLGGFILLGAGVYLELRRKHFKAMKKKMQNAEKRVELKIAAIEMGMGNRARDAERGISGFEKNVEKGVERVEGKIGRDFLNIEREIGKSLAKKRKKSRKSGRN